MNIFDKRNLLPNINKSKSHKSIINKKIKYSLYKSIKILKNNNKKINKNKNIKFKEFSYNYKKISVDSDKIEIDKLEVLKLNKINKNNNKNINFINLESILNFKIEIKELSFLKEQIKNNIIKINEKITIFNKFKEKELKSRKFPNIFISFNTNNNLIFFDFNNMLNLLEGKIKYFNDNINNYLNLEKTKYELKNNLFVKINFYKIKINKYTNKIKIVKSKIKIIQNEIEEKEITIIKKRTTDKHLKMLIDNLSNSVDKSIFSSSNENISDCSYSSGIDEKTLYQEKNNLNYDNFKTKNYSNLCSNRSNFLPIPVNNVYKSIKQLVDDEDKGIHKYTNTYNLLKDKLQKYENMNKYVEDKYNKYELEINNLDNRIQNTEIIIIKINKIIKNIKDFYFKFINQEIKKGYDLKEFKGLDWLFDKVVNLKMNWKKLDYPDYLILNFKEYFINKLKLKYDIKNIKENLHKKDKIFNVFFNKINKTKYKNNKYVENKFKTLIKETNLLEDKILKTNKNNNIYNSNILRDKSLSIENLIINSNKNIKINYKLPINKKKTIKHIYIADSNYKIKLENKESNYNKKFYNKGKQILKNFINNINNNVDYKLNKNKDNIENKLHPKINFIDENKKVNDYNSNREYYKNTNNYKVDIIKKEKEIKSIEIKVLSLLSDDNYLKFHNITKTKKTLLLSLFFGWNYNKILKKFLKDK